MNGIELMVLEHTYIKRMLNVMRSASYGVLKGEPIVRKDFDQMIDFVRNYADNHHHGKEERMLFNRMMEELGPVAEKLVRHGMLVEHDLGRLFIRQLEEALDRVEAGEDEARLDVIGNAIGYTDLLTRHIDKEDNVVYPFSQNNLSAGTRQIIDTECEAFEQETEQSGVQNKYINLLEELEARYRTGVNRHD